MTQAPPTLRMVVLDASDESVEVYPPYEEEKTTLEKVKDPWSLVLTIDKTLMLFFPTQMRKGVQPVMYCDLGTAFL